MHARGVLPDDMVEGWKRMVEGFKRKVEEQQEAAHTTEAELVGTKELHAEENDQLQSTSARVSCSRCRVLEQSQRGLQQKLNSWVDHITTAEAQRNAAEVRVNDIRKELEVETTHKQTLELQAMQLEQRVKSLLAENKTLQEGAMTTRRASSGTQATDTQTKVKESGVQHIADETLTERPQTSPSTNEVEQLKARVAELESEVEELMIMAKVGHVLALIGLILTLFDIILGRE